MKNALVTRRTCHEKITCIVPNLTLSSWLKDKASA